MQSLRAPNTRDLLAAAGWGTLLAVATRYVYELPAEFFWIAKAGVPWLVAAFAVGACVRSGARGAVRGLVTLTVAVLVYYAILGWVQHAYEVSPVGVGWVVVAVPGGALFGWLGALWRAGTGRVSITAIVAASFAAEALLMGALMTGRELAVPVLLACAVATPLLLLPERKSWPRAAGLALAFTGVAFVAELGVYVSTGYVS